MLADVYLYFYLCTVDYAERVLYFDANGERFSKVFCDEVKVVVCSSPLFSVVGFGVLPYDFEILGS
jgi:hypothetical protein